MPGFNKSDANMMRTAWELSAGLLSFVVAIGIGFWFGAHCSTRGWGRRRGSMVVFLCFGFVAGVLNVYRTVSRAVRRPPPGAAGAVSHAGERDERGGE